MLSPSAMLNISFLPCLKQSNGYMSHYPKQIVAVLILSNLWLEGKHNIYTNVL